MGVLFVFVSSVQLLKPQRRQSRLAEIILSLAASAFDKPIMEGERFSYSKFVPDTLNFEAERIQLPGIAAMASQMLILAEQAPFAASTAT